MAEFIGEHLTTILVVSGIALLFFGKPLLMFLTRGSRKELRDELHEKDLRIVALFEEVERLRSQEGKAGQSELSEFKATMNARLLHVEELLSRIEDIGTATHDQFSKGCVEGYATYRELATRVEELAKEQRRIADVHEGIGDWPPQGVASSNSQPTFGSRYRASRDERTGVVTFEDMRSEEKLTSELTSLLLNYSRVRPNSDEGLRCIRGILEIPYLDRQRVRFGVIQGLNPRISNQQLRVAKLALDYQAGMGDLLGELDFRGHNMRQGVHYDDWPRHI